MVPEVLLDPAFRERRVVLEVLLVRAGPEVPLHLFHHAHLGGLPRQPDRAGQLHLLVLPDQPLRGRRRDRLHLEDRLDPQARMRLVRLEPRLALPRPVGPAGLAILVGQQGRVGLQDQEVPEVLGPVPSKKRPPKLKRRVQQSGEYARVLFHGSPDALAVERCNTLKVSSGNLCFEAHTVETLYRALKQH